MSRFTLAVCTVWLALPLHAQSTAWPRSTPAREGLNAAVFDSLDREIRAGTYGYVDRMVVVRHGKLVVDQHYANDYDAAYGDSAKVKSAMNASDPTGPYNYYASWWHPFYRRGTLHSEQSVSKTVMSMVVGVARTRGEFPALTTPILRFFDTTQVKNIDARKRKIQIRHLLTMTGGFEWNDGLPLNDPNNTESQLEASFDWVDFMINRPMMREPGTVFNYSSGESILVGAVFARATGRDLEAYAAEHLFAPLGITNWFWKRTPAGALDTEGGLYLEATDLAKLWQLWLQRGMWNGKRIVSEEWITESTTPAVATSDAPNSPKYGFKWWLYPDPRGDGKYIWSGSGFGGQFPMAFPDDDLVVVFNSWNVLPGKKALPMGKVRERLAKAIVK
jgi:CubicO group peptidase (beta-lactamase class C family)